MTMNRKSKLSVQMKDKKSSKETVCQSESDKSDPKKLTASTSVHKNHTKDDTDDELLSPLAMRFTQDLGDDELDVVWDWDSPRSKGNKKIHRKRILHSSPKLPKKQLSVNYGVPKFSLLKAELEELASRLNAPQNVDVESDNWTGQKNCEESDCLVEKCSIFQNDSVFDNDTVSVFVKPKTPTPSDDDLFNDDSLDQEMFKCSQQVEEAHQVNQSCSSLVNHNNNKGNLEKNKSGLEPEIENDSFDVFLEEIKDEEIDLLSQSGSSSCSQPPLQVKRMVTTVSSPRAICRTNSVPIELLASPQVAKVSTCTVFSRTKSEELSNKKVEQTQVRCSPEEIEKKRQEAIAKLEWRRKQNEIEKKRLEALKRLKRNRMQRLLSSQSVKPLHR